MRKMFVIPFDLLFSNGVLFVIIYIIRLKKSCRQWEKLANGLKGAAEVIAVDLNKTPQFKTKYLTSNVGSYICQQYSIYL